MTYNISSWTDHSNQFNSKKQLKTIIFKKSVKKFCDLNLKVIGPFEAGDVLQTDIDIANLLILKNKAKEFDID